MIEFFNEDVSLPDVLSANTKIWILKVIESHNFVAGDINYKFCSDEHILEVNKQFLNHDYYTDIITFDYCFSNVVSGDLVISTETVLSNSKLLNVDFNTELHRVIIHGILHLIGFKDKTSEEQREMRNQEDKALSLLSSFH